MGLIRFEGISNRSRAIMSEMEKEGDYGNKMWKRRGER